MSRENPVLVASSAAPSIARMLAHGIADETGGPVHGRHVVEIGRVGLVRALDELLVEQADDRLGERQIAGRQQHHHALARLAPVMQLAELGDVVDAGIGARVGHEHQAAVQPHATQ